MPTKNESISLVDDTEDITAVKAPPPGLIRESKMVAVTEPLIFAGVNDSPDMPTPPIVVATAAPSRAPRVTLPAGAPRAPMPIAPELVISYQRPVVDLVPIGPGGGGISMGGAPFAARWSPRTPSRTGLYLLFAALLAGGAGLIGWRQWSARPGRIEISTTPPDALIAVGTDALALHSPVVLERPPGSYKIFVAHEGYQPSHRTIDLQAGQDVVLAIALAPATGGGSASEHTALAEPPGARPAAAAGAARHAATAGRPGPVHPAAPSRPDPGVAALLAARSGALAIDRRPPPLHAPEGPPPSPTPAGDSPPPATSPPTGVGVGVGLGAASAEESPAAGAPRAMATVPPAPAPEPRAAASTTTTADTSGARTVSGRIAKAQLAIDANADEYRVPLPPSLARAEMKLAAVVKVCVSTDGRVADVKLLKSADPAVDPLIPAVLGKWRFRPLLVDGRAVPFCYVTQYEIGAR